MIEPGAEAETLVGRLEELRFLQHFVRHIGVNGGALLLSGDPGVGKSALLEATAEFAHPAEMTVLRVIGTEFEAQVSFGALNQALLPLIDDFGELGDEHARALSVALGCESGAAPDRLLLASAATLLLRKAAARTPLLLIIDDLQWLDRASAGVLSFVARRLVGSRAGMLAACRTGEVGFFDTSGLPERAISALDDGAAARLLADRFPRLDPEVRARVLATAQGNPLALLELPQALHAGWRGPPQSVPRILPLGTRLQRLFASQVRALPARTRTLLLTAALESTCDLRLLSTAAGLGYHLDDLAPAEQDRLVRVDTDSHQVMFRHPLIRSAVVAESTSAERRRVHQTLAEALAADPERQAWHLGEATVEPDEAVAALLETAAHDVARRGDYQAVISLLCRAADLSPSAAARSRRMAAAAYMGAEGLATTHHTAGLLEGVRQEGRHAHASLHYASAAALLLLDSDGQIDIAHQLLTGAMRNHVRSADGDEQELLHALRTLVMLCFIGGRAELWTAFYEEASRLTSLPELLVLCVDMSADTARTGVAALPRLDAALADAHHETDLTRVQALASSAMYADRIVEVREPLWRIIQDGRAGGPGRQRIVALMNVCIDDFHRGEWAEAAELAAEGLSVCEEFAATSFGWCFRYVQALLAAVQGSFETSRALANQIIGWGGPRGLGMARAYARQALALAAAGEGDYEEAYRHATAISPAGTLPSHMPHSLWVALDLVEAAVRTGRTAEAERHALVLREAGVAALSPRLMLMEAACEGLVAQDREAVRHFDRALSLPTVDEWPFDTAHVRLLYGERLRRTRATTEAKAQLKSALTAFEKLGAVPWTVRAERELRAAGQATRNSSGARGAAALTPQELEVARLAASGMTNKEIAERLFVSPRTVSSHLSHVFPKLGITKRAALRDAIGSGEPR
ncbi:AAA family ATPase [Streptomyces sp. NPDC017673]|uniref:helix-turn-helix transcriptional regulator n=1 Tax=unclassified Streptomyces TaxID=2593676 RepID=UPI0037B7A6D2